MKKVYVCAPIGGNIEENLKKVKTYTEYALRCGTAPVVPHFYAECLRFLYKGIIIKHNKTEPTYTKTSLFLCEKRRFFMARTEKGVVTTI